MALIPQCDNCDEIFKEGFINNRKKVIVIGSKKKDFNVEIIIRPPHLCIKCFKKIMREALKE